MIKKSLVYEKAFNFSIRIVKMFQYLQDKKEYVMSKQVVRFGTSIGANIKEALYAQSKKDFAHKMNIALKESAETEYWLELLKETQYISNEMFNSAIEENREILKMLASIVKTSKENLES